MPFQKGKSGNPSGRPKEKAFADAVRLAVNREGPDGRRKLQAIAEKLADAAVAGEPWAIAQIGDRLDGKPAQSLEHSGDMTLRHEDALEQLDQSPPGHTPEAS